MVIHIPRPDDDHVRAPWAPPPSFAMLAPLLRWLEARTPVARRKTFAVGTALPDGRLDLCKQSLGPDGLRRLAPGFDDHPYVRHLLLGADNLGPEGATVLGDVFAKSPRLQTAYLGCNYVGPYGAAALADPLQDHPGVRHLWLKRNGLSAAGVEALAPVLRRGRIEVLDLVTNDLGAAGVARAVELLPHDGGAVHTLFVCGNGIGPEGAAAVASRLPALAGLRRLYLSMNHLGDDGLSTLLPAVAAHGRLEVLALASNGLTSEGMAPLAEMVAAHPRLEHLDLGYAPATRVLKATPNAVDGQAAGALAAMLRAAPRLRALDLTGAPWLPEDARQLVEAVDAAPRMIDLRLSGDFPAPLRQRLHAVLARHRNEQPPPPVPAEIRAIRSVYRTAKGPPPVAAPTSASQAPLPKDLGFTPQELAACRRVLDALALRTNLIDHAELADLPVRMQQILRRRRSRGGSERRGVRVDRAAKDPVVAAPRPRAAREARGACYVCKSPFTEPHPRYPLMCQACGALNVAKREQSADLSGRIALVTGGRIKIGHEIALSMLRNGATVVATTRFPNDAARRFAESPDFERWRSRLVIVGLDLVHTPSVEAFAGELERVLPHLDILINNAAQTIRKPAAFYRELAAGEREALRPGAQSLLRTALGDGRFQADALDVDARLFPVGSDDGHGQLVDLRSTNSWRLTVDQVSAPELLETTLVSAVAPFVLVGRLRSLMVRSPAPERFVVNVSAMEGKFERRYKSPFHPHTNAAKAALNMLTRTSASDLAQDGIYMTSVDTGWITNENPMPIADRMRRAGFVAPLDVIDGAARVLDPIYEGIKTGQPQFGVFLKDYRPVTW